MDEIILMFNINQENIVFNEVGEIFIIVINLFINLVNIEFLLYVLYDY